MPSRRHFNRVLTALLFIVTVMDVLVGEFGLAMSTACVCVLNALLIVVVEERDRLRQKVDELEAHIEFLIDMSDHYRCALDAMDDYRTLTALEALFVTRPGAR